MFKPFRVPFFSALLLIFPFNVAVGALLRETVVFCSDMEPGVARLLFEPSRVVSVTSADGSMQFERGRDFTIDSGNRQLLLTPQTRIPVMQVYQPLQDADHKLLHTPGGWAYSWSAHEKHKRYDLTVTYETAQGGAEWTDLLRAHTFSKIKSVGPKLRAGRAVKIVLYGDSITHGSQASGWPVETPARQTAPGQLPYGEEMVRRLRTRYGDARIAVTNLSEPGKGSGQGAGLENLARLNQEQPDLVIVAWGMNDAGLPAADYEHNLRAIVTSIRTAKSDAAIVLVAEMMPSPELGPARAAAHVDHGRILAQIYQDNTDIGLADVGAITRFQLGRKKYPDLLANGFNHPGDYLQATYADAVTAAVLPESTAPSR